MKNNTIIIEFDLSHIKDNSVGLLILERFLTKESIAEIAEDYQANNLMVEEALRQEFLKLFDLIQSQKNSIQSSLDLIKFQNELIESKELALKHFTRNSRY